LAFGIFINSIYIISSEGVEKHVKNCKTTRFLAKYGGLQKKNYGKSEKYDFFHTLSSIS